MKCEICLKDTKELFRSNPIGFVPAVWICEKCAINKRIHIDPEIKRIFKCFD